MSDKELIEEVLKGHPSMYELLIRRHNSLLYKTGRGYRFSHQDTQDLMQDTFVDAYYQLAKFENRSGFKTWLVRIMLNNCYHKKQKQRFINSLPPDFESTEPLYASYNNQTGKMLMNKELGQILETAISGLADDYRMAFVLREVSGLSVRETAEALAISEDNVKMRCSRAKSMLRREIEKTYRPEELFEFNLIYCDKIVEGVMQRLTAKTEMPSNGER